MLDRTAQGSGSRLQLAEEPHVLDRNDSLIGERLQQLYFRVREAPGLGAGHIDGAHRLALTQHRHRDGAPKPEPSARPPHELDHGLGFGIRNVHHRPCEDRDAGCALRVEQTRILGTNARPRLG